MERGGLPGTDLSDSESPQQHPDPLFPGLNSLPVGPRSGIEFTRPAEYMLIAGQLLAFAGAIIFAFKAIGAIIGDDQPASVVDDIIIPAGASILMLVNLIVIARVRKL